MANEIIRPSELPAASEVFTDASLVVDSGTSVQKATPQQIVDAANILAVDVATTGGSTVQSVLNRLVAESRTLESFGAVGDGATDDLAAINAAWAWVYGADYREITSQGGKRYRLSAGVTPQTPARRGLSFNLSSPFAPDTGAYRAITIQSIYHPYINISFIGGGVDADYMAPLPASGRLPDQSEAICIKGCRRPTGKISADGYIGRVLRCETGGVFKNSFLDLVLECGDIANSGTGSLSECGQGFAFTGSANSTAYGGFSYINTAWCKYPDLADSVVDFHATHWEAAAAEFRGCGSVWIGTALLGDETITRTGFKFTTNAAGGKCRRIDFGVLQAVQFAVALDLDAVADDAHGVVIKSLYTNGCLVGLQGKDMGTVRVLAHESTGDTVPARYYGAVVKVEHHLTSRGARQQGVKIESTASGIYLISPDLRLGSQQTAGMYSHILIDSTVARVDIINPLLQGNEVSGAVNAIVTDIPNNAHGGLRILGGRVETSTKFERAEPQVIDNVQGITSKRTFDATMPSGQSTVTVAHGLFGAPQGVTLGARGPELGGLYWTADATNVTLTVPAPVTANRSVTVTAVRRP